MIYLLAVAVIALLVLSYEVHSAGRVFSRIIDRPVTVPEPLDTVDIERRLDDLTLAVDEGIRRIDRAESRVQKTVTSARRQLREAGQEHAGIEAEYEELHDGDEGGGEVEAVPALPAYVEPDKPSGIPGLSRSELAELRSRAHV